MGFFIENLPDSIKRALRTKEEFLDVVRTAKLAQDGTESQNDANSQDSTEDDADSQEGDDSEDDVEPQN